MQQAIAAALAAQGNETSDWTALALLLCLLLAATGFVGWERRSTGYKVMTIISFVGILAIILFVARGSNT